MTAPTIENAVRRNPWRIAAVALLPIMVLGLLLAALWNPQDRLDQVPAAIVNLDEPVEVQGQTVPLGRQLASGLVSGGETADGAKAAQPADDATNFAWTITDEDSAKAGLVDGTYAAVVTIPEGFSAAATSYGNDDPSEARQATIDVSTPPGGRVADDALARVVAATATSVMSSTLTETYVDNVLVGFNDLSDGIGQAQDGAVQLADGAGQTEDGADQLADGAGQVADGAGDLASGVGELGTGADQLASGAGDLAGGADQLAGGVSQSASGADGIASGVEDLASGTQGLAGGARDLADGLALLYDGTPKKPGVSAMPEQTQQLADYAALLSTGVGDLVASLSGAADTAGDALTDLSDRLGCDGSAGELLPPEIAELLTPEQRAELAQALSGQSKQACADIAKAQKDLDGQTTQLGQLDQLATGVAQGTGDLAAGTPALASGISDLADGADGLAGGMEETASGAGDLAVGARGLADGLGSLSTGASTLAGGAGELATGTQGLASGVGELGTGATQLATGTEGIASGAGDLAGGVGQLASGADDLASGLDDAKNQIPTYSDDERKTLASVVAEPVAAPSASGISTGASGPLFAVVALWLGALALLTVFPPVVARALGSTRDSVRLALQAFALPAAVGAGTGALVGVVLAAVENLDVGGWFGSIIVGAVASVAFVAVHQGFLGWLGNLGRGISLLIAVLLIATGIVATVPTLLQGLVDALPVGAARDALTAVVVPAAGGLGMGVTLLVLWGLGGLALAALVTARGRRFGVGRLLRA
ncbi:YhgE/Pip domain-containing protein [Krasilnikoviella flava]|uniref:Putative membrane protein n=1 Tax=Krasilnikoviella flava TaxID=526729 RepID=A0A1T5LKW3_9MICO|nr:YhgE/Pip domain-containing protein [Krasilnikoviella flava]SKC76524.1 putative membrane protein [Krasilnikoviella flava]